MKVFSGQCHLIELGFRQGGPAGYGLRRQLIDRDRNPKGLLYRGERKSLLTDRVILVPGPELEIETVRQIYDLFAIQGKTEHEIMEMLNGRGVLGEHGRPWTRAIVHQVLTNPKYIGANIYNRRSFKLKHKRIKNPVQMWIWRDGAFEPIVTASLFEKRDITNSRIKNSLNVCGSCYGFRDDSPASSSMKPRICLPVPVTPLALEASRAPIHSSDGIRIGTMPTSRSIAD